MNTIERVDKHILVDGEYVDDTINNYLEKLCMKHFKSLKTIKDGCYLLGIKRSNPIYISNKCILIEVSRTRNLDSYYFNYQNVIDIQVFKEVTWVSFKDGTETWISISEYRMKMLLKKTNILLEYLRYIDYL